MLCDGGAYALSNLEVPTGLTDRSLDMLMWCGYFLWKDQGLRFAKLVGLDFHLASLGFPCLRIAVGLGSIQMGFLRVRQRKEEQCSSTSRSVPRSAS